MTLDPIPTAALTCACTNLRRAARAVTQMYDDALRDSGLRSTQFTFLQVLSLKGELTQGQLAQLLVIDSTTLTRTLGALRRSGWIRSRSGDDRRERHWSLTPKGRQKVVQVRPAWEAVQERVRSRIGRRRLDALFDDLAAMVAAAS